MAHRILLIEDEAPFRHTYRDVLVNEGYEVLEAEDGEKGWEMAKSEKPDLVLLDLVLPKMDGFSVLKRIRTDQETAHIPVIILSVLEEQQDIKKGMDIGANDYLMKGFYAPREIVHKIFSLMQKKPADVYRIGVLPHHGDSEVLAQYLHLTDFTCPACKALLRLELVRDNSNTGGHYFTAHFTCEKCKKIL